MADELVHCVEKGGWYLTISKNNMQISNSLSQKNTSLQKIEEETLSIKFAETYQNYFSLTLNIC